MTTQTLHGEWQPIETAPKDGTCILSYAPPRREDDPAYAVVHWWVDRYESYEPVKGSDTFRRVVKEGSAWWEGGPWSPWRATHWMPLPEPPK